MSAYTAWTVELETSGLTLNANPLFESSSTDWTGINGATITRDTTVSHQGTASLKVVGNGSTGNPSARNVAPAAATVGATYAGSIWVYCATAYASGAAAVLDWRDAGNTSTVSSTIPTSTPLAAGVWTQLTVSGTCPVGAANVLLRFRVGGTPSAAVAFFIDEARLTNPAVSWLDITNYVSTKDSPIRNTYGRQDELSQITPGSCSFKLEDADHRFLPASPASPFWPTIRKGSRVRVSVTANATTFRRHTGYIQDIQPDPIGDVGLYQLVEVMSVDRLARLAGMPALQSPLYQEILAQQGGALLAYYPMTEGASADRSLDATGQRRPLIRTLGLRAAGTTPAALDQGSMVYGGGVGPPYGGGTAPQWRPRSSPTARFDSSYVLRSDESASPYTIATGETITLQGWVYPQEVVDHETNYNEIVFALDSLSGGVGPGSDPVLIVYHTRGTAEPPDHGIMVVVNSGSWTSSGYAVTNVLPVNQLSLLAVQVTLGTPGTVRVWINGAQYTGALTTAFGTTPASIAFNRLNVGAGAWSGSISHVQVYKGSYTLAKHQAQALVGRAGLEGQTTNARINTAATYAGVTSGDLSLESGQSTMGAASWSDATPYDVMHEAEEAEGGVLFARGDGVLVFHSRSHRRNDDGAVTSIPKSWIGADLQIRQDDPINDATVSRSGGASARSVDTASVATYGTNPGGGTIAVASDSELSYRAGWLTYAYATPRVRTPSVALDLTWRSAAERATVLSLDISSRLALTGLPATVPPEATALYVEGWSEEIGITGHRISLNCSPVIGSIPGRSDVFWQIGHPTRGQIDSVYTVAP